MRITIVGSDYVVLVLGACFADFGHEVFCVDVDQRTIDAMHASKMPIYEPALAKLVRRNVEAKRRSFTTSITEGVREPKRRLSRSARRCGAATAIPTSAASMPPLS